MWFYEPERKINYPRTKRRIDSLLLEENYSQSERKLPVFLIEQNNSKLEKSKRATK